MPTLSIDFETRSTVSLPDTGVYVYAMHESTDVWCMAWAFDDEEPQLWWPTPSWHMDAPTLPARMLHHIRQLGEIRAHNASFERIIWREVMVKKYGAPAVQDAQWVCSAAEAAAMALPRSLGECARVTGIATQKDTEGHNLMMRMCRPRSYRDDGTPVWWDVPEKLQRLGAYCIQDVKTEQALTKVLRRLSPDQRATYLLDQRINDRGVQLDRELIEAAQRVATTGIERANAQMRELTEGMVTSVSNHRSLRTWLDTQCVGGEGVGKAVVAELLEQELPERVREVLTTRADAGRSSIAKLKKMLACMCDDGRARGLYLYHAATTGRWGGRLVQPQNFPRGEVKRIEDFIPLVLNNNYDGIELTAHPLSVVLSMLRSMLCAGEGRVLVAGDYSAIEARVLNWLAAEDHVLDSFRAYDAGDKTQDPYVLMAAQMGEGVERQVGKAAELGCGFQMGAEKFVSAAWAVYQVRVTEAQAALAVRAYRNSHQNVAELWSATNSACMRAIATPGVPVTFGPRSNLRVIVTGAYMYLKLPSGRMLTYPAPEVRESLAPWGEMHWGIEYSSIDGTNQWTRHRTYGGHLVENIVQAVACDLLAEAMRRLEKAGFNPVLHSHDEIVCEAHNRRDWVDIYTTIMAELPAWAAGLPVSVEGWQGKRYRK